MALCNELLRCYRSLRFRISYGAVVAVFLVGAISFAGQWQDMQQEYIRYREQSAELLARRAGNLTSVAINRQQYIMEPRISTLIDDCNEALLPSCIAYDAYGIWEVEVRNNLTNPLMERDTPVNWAFIVSMFLSFIALLLSYDAVSGGKQSRMLAFTLSYPVSRFSLLCAMYLSVILAVGVMLLSGILVSTTVLLCMGILSVGGSFVIEVLGFLFFSFWFIALFAALGLLASILTKHTLGSALACVSFWLVFVVVIPNSSVFLASRLLPLSMTKEDMEKEIGANWTKLMDEAPPSSWGSRENNPFYPPHELRAALHQQIRDMKQKYYDAYLDGMFRQYELTRRILLFSPLTQFERMNEIWLDSGSERLRKNLKGLEMFREDFLAWFKAKDAEDPDSPHWYNPDEYYSTSNKPVAVEEIPRYEEPVPAWTDRCRAVYGYLLAMMGITAFLFILSYAKFKIYDVR